MTIRTLRPAGLLLEVIIALVVLVAAMGMMGGQLVGGLKLTSNADVQTRAVQLSDRMLALLELDPTLAERFFNDRTSDGDFGEQNPGYFWRAAVDVTDMDGLGQVTLDILYQPDSAKRDSIESASVIKSVHLLKANPGRIDLASDFGLPTEQIEEFTGALPIPIDPTALNPQELVGLDPATLLEVLPQLLALLQQMGVNLDQVAQGGAPPTLDQLRELLEQNGIDAGGIQDLLPDGVLPPGGLDGLPNSGGRNPGARDGANNGGRNGGGRDGAGRGGRGGRGGNRNDAGAGANAGDNQPGAGPSRRPGRNGESGANSGNQPGRGGPPGGRGQSPGGRQGAGAGDGDDQGPPTPGATPGGRPGAGRGGNPNGAAPQGRGGRSGSGGGASRTPGGRTIQDLNRDRKGAGGGRGG